jgi:hypothetical protein
MHVNKTTSFPSAPDFSELHDALLCIGISGPFGPEWTESWLDPPPWAPVSGHVYTPAYLEGPPHYDTWTEDHCLTTTRLFSIFQGLSERTKDALRLPMRRLNSAMRRISRADRAIDLGIALEALFLSDLDEDRGEITFRLSLRMARYLRHDSEKRTSVFKTAKKLYGLRSTAIHTGQISADKATSEILQEGSLLTAEAIRRFIEDGPPNWQAIQLG